MTDNIIFLSQIVGTDMVSEKQGVDVYLVIEKYLNKNERVVIDFSSVIAITTFALRKMLELLIVKFGKQFVIDNIQLKNETHAQHVTYFYVMNLIDI